MLPCARKSAYVKAVYFERFGGPEVLICGDRPDPVPKPDEVLIEIAAASINATDWKARAGSYRPPAGHDMQFSFPLVLGRDLSGTISAVGKDVASFKVGDEVFAVCMRFEDGCYAEKNAVRANMVGKKPASVSHVESAALALTALTTVSALEETLQLQRGETILIQGGAGGVAGIAIQFAKYLGARVITTASAVNHDYVRKLGADEVIDYNAVDFAEVVKGVDAALDTVGGAVAEKTLDVLRPGGRAAFLDGDAPTPRRSDIKSLKPPVKRSTRNMNRVAELIDAGAFRPPEIRVFSLEQAQLAHALIEARHVRGKLVFKIR
jgi:NADPH:quinone reductase-like Zn-dependent oxidoreductase